ncbi:hypothetical protein [Desulforamulus aeronauticus]|uniref:hypothetical protein n=1 Tax=Desulforamulus aeronauticus TaxID=53343 RepID=UPI000934F11C|nr:hypothetical protein [Desulforamulus aeronauticus]
MSRENPGLCPLSVAARQNRSSFEILSIVKEIRDHLLSQTEKGRTIISLYASCSPALVKAVLLDGRFRSTVLDGLARLKPAIVGIRATLGSGDRDYVFTEADANTVAFLMDITIAKLPKGLATQAKALEQELHLYDMPGKTVAEYLRAVKLL